VLGAELNAIPKLGTCHERLSKHAAEHMPVLDAGEDTYCGGWRLPTSAILFSVTGILL
jgi:hypothetical protein